MKLRAVYEGKDAMIEKGFSVVKDKIVEEALIVSGAVKHRERLNICLRSLYLDCI